MKARGLFAILILFVLLTPPVAGDGVPVIEEELHSVTHETRQIALVEVKGNHEIMHLFLSIVSLDPGKNITVLIPLRTEPESLSVENTTESNFSYSYNITQVRWKYQEVLRGANITLDYYLTSTAIFTSSSMIVPFLGWYFFGQVIKTHGYGSASAGGTIHFHTGDSAEIYNVSTVEDLEEIYEKYNMSMPESVRKTLQRYSSFHLVALHLRSRAPISEDKYRELMENCPKTMALFREYVKEHPRVKAEAMGHFSIITGSLPDFDDVLKSLKNETESKDELREYFYDVVNAIYGFGNMRGIDFTVKMPLDKGKAFYPLGTSPAWNSSGKIRVFFKVPENRTAQFNLQPNYMVRYHGYRYYQWNFDLKLPEEDVEGRIHDLDASMQLADRMEDFYIYNSRTNGILFIFLGVITAVLIWFALLIGYVKLYGGEQILRERRFIAVLLALSAFAVFISGAIGIGVMVYLTSKKVESEGINTTDRNYIYSSVYIALVILSMPVIFSLTIFELAAAAP